MNELEYFLRRQKIISDAQKKFKKDCEEISELLKEVKHIGQSMKAEGHLKIEDEGRLIRSLKAGTEAMNRGYIDF